MPGPLPILIPLFVIAALCVPPILLAQMLWRRRDRLQGDHPRAFRAALGAAFGVAIANLAVSLFFPPGQGIGTVHLVALALSWFCLCGSGGLAFLVRPRRRSIA